VEKDADDDRVSGTERLRTSGVGVVLGGVALGVLSLFAGYTTASVAVTALGVAGWPSERANDGTRIGVGVAVVGVIGVVESSTSSAWVSDPSLSRRSRSSSASSMSSQAGSSDGWVGVGRSL